MTSTNSSAIASHSYSTIFHCDEDFFICFLRFLEGAVSLGMCILFLKGYRAIKNQNNNPILNEDKLIFILAMCQTAILTLYYFLFEQFFLLATIRNLMIWISINVLQNLCNLYVNNAQLARKVSWGINGLKVLNFLLWFVIAVGHGSLLVNTSFNLGYNCRVIDWSLLSGILLILTLAESFVAFQIVQKLNWEQKQPNIQNDDRKLKSIQEQRQYTILLVGGQAGAALIMFIWDYLAFSLASTDQDCESLFSGNSFFRKVLCFLLKIMCMQAVPCIVYYTNYYKRRNQLMDNVATPQQMGDFDPLDDAYSDLNRSLTSRSNSRNSLFSRNGSTANL